MWTSSSEVEFQCSVVVGSISSRGDHGIYGWLKPNTAETAIQWFCKSHVVLAAFSGHGNTIYNMQFLNLKKNVNNEMT